MTVRLAVVVSGFPRTSETFAVGELVALARAGMLARLFATKTGDGAALQPGVQELLPFLSVLPPGDAGTRAAALVGALDGAGVDGVHGYFAHEPAAVAELAAERLGVDFSFSVHALDARKVAPDELVRRARNAAGVVACNTDVAQHVDVPGVRLRLLPHGVDLRRFDVRPRPVGDERLRVLAVGRLVEKKGFPTLVEAVSRLQVPWTLRIVGTGTGTGAAQVQATVDRHGLAGRVELAGRRSHTDLPADYAWADVVTVPSVVDATGDRDGLPNVVLEAMASGRPQVVSDVAALGETVRTAGSGLVVPPGDASALAVALTKLTDPLLRSSLGDAGRRHVEEHFDLTHCTRTLLEHLEVIHARAPEPVDA